MSNGSVQSTAIKMIKRILMILIALDHFLMLTAHFNQQNSYKDVLKVFFQKIKTFQIKLKSEKIKKNSQLKTLKAAKFSKLSHLLQLWSHPSLQRLNHFSSSKANLIGHSLTHRRLNLKPTMIHPPWDWLVPHQFSPSCNNPYFMPRKSEGQ